MKLNLGCGPDYRKGWVNVDQQACFKPDQIVNLDSFQWPWADNSVDEIFCSHVLEHLHHPERAWAECGRILKPGGRVTMIVPHFSRSWLSGTHKRAFSLPALDAFAVEGYCPKGVLRKIRQELHYVRHVSYNNKTIFIIAPLVDWLANKHQTLCERIWCYWVGGFDEIRFEYEKR
jgi:ubiquinone/menaquinone biosynthesis C-methylase UbiE